MVSLQGFRVQHTYHPYGAWDDGISMFYNISAPSGARDYIIPECYTHFVHAINLRNLRGLEIIFHLNAAQRTPAPDVIYDLSMIWDLQTCHPRLWHRAACRCYKLSQCICHSLIRFLLSNWALGAGSNIIIGSGKKHPWLRRSQMFVALLVSWDLSPGGVT